MHPIMAAMGISFCVFLTMALMEPFPFRWRPSFGSAAVAAPLGWIFAPSTASWQLTVAAKSYYSIYRWAWYEWLGALAPLFLFWLLWRVALKWGRETHGPEDAVDSKTKNRLARFALAVFAYGSFQQVAAMAMQAPDALVRLAPLQPMRYLQLVYVFMALVGGGLLGRYLLKTKVWRWAVYLLVLNGGMFLVQWEMIDDGAHLELPTVTTANPWLQAFAWVRENTPTNAYFALDPRYLARPGEGFHGFRALAERSQLADGIKDTAVAMEVPSLAPRWHQQQLAQAGWQHFQLADFERLKTQFGVSWVLVNFPQPEGLECRWHNGTVAVCRVP